MKHQSESLSLGAKTQSDLGAVADRIKKAEKSSCFTWCAGRPLGGQLNGVWQTKWRECGTGTELVRGTC